MGFEDYMVEELENSTETERAVILQTPQGKALTKKWQQEG
jgi:hypothetical protein